MTSLVLERNLAYKNAFEGVPRLRDSHGQVFVSSASFRRLPERGQSGNKNLKVGQEWEQNGNKVGTRTPKWDKNGN